MASLLREARTRLFTPNRIETTLARRGFFAKDEATRLRLENVGATFLDGFEAALRSKDVQSATAVLDAVDRPFRGFAFEGAGMGFAVLDGMPGNRGGRVRQFLEGPGEPHIYMAYVGIGWALAKLPRFCWSNVDAPDPLLRWLVMDGYGFYHAYFKTNQYVHQQLVGPPLRWPAGVTGNYAQRGIDQGIGRAMWFVAGANPGLAASLIGRFAPDRQPDLWAGIGLAATYAGGVTEEELTELRRVAGQYRPQLAQGSTFGAQARVYAGLVTEHTPVATGILCGMTPEEAGKITEMEKAALPDDGDEPAFEIWRQRIQSHF
ncbi:DUF1702 family protein [Allocatelliglobosispora scoriae]|uniref:DUF1702 family protein n=1 Tax=Allocatelliglobosispora scoriae TaxID=643052 RepID=UPI0028B0486C|nr:DUF1702 family protein [Allocatelliglobosispora scoriae]